MGRVVDSSRSWSHAVIAVITAMVLSGGCFVGLSFGQERDREVSVTDHRSRSPIVEMLRKRVDRVAWEDTSLAEVLDWLRNQSRDPVNVLARWRALEAVGVDRQSPVTLQLAGTTVGQVLAEALDQLSGSDPLVYVGEGNTLRITTRSDMRRKLITQVYDVAEVVMQSRGLRVRPMFVSGQQVNLGAVTGTPGAGIGGTGQTFQIGASLFGDASRDDDDDEGVSADELAERVVEAIVTTVAPDTWRVNGGRGTVSVIDGVLIVRNSADVHEMLGGAFRLDGPASTR